MLSKEEVERIANLARLELTGKEAEKMQKDLSEILDYFNLLKQAPKSELNSAQPAAVNSHLRKDEAKPRDAEEAQRIIAAFPDKKDDYIKVKTIL